MCGNSRDVIDTVHSGFLKVVLCCFVSWFKVTTSYIFLSLSGDVPYRPATGISKREEIVPILHYWLKMRETPMQNSENSLLPLRRKISPPTILNFEAHAIEQADGDKEITNALGKRERLLSASSRSVSTLKYKPSLSERCLTPPFTPLANCDIRENSSQSFRVRRPSEHFLEVLEAQKGGQTLPKMPSATSLPPLQKPPSHSEDSLRKTTGEVKTAFSGNVSNGGFSRPIDCDSQLLLESGARKAFLTLNQANGKILRKTNSLPVIKTSSTLTNGLSDINGSPFRNRTKSAVIRRERAVDESERARSPFDENLEEIDHVNQVFDEDEEEQDPEKVSMIRNWLKECEKAKIT